ncbi:MAG: hypothetical protein ACOX1U_10025 [Saccharofermentanales bacterium]|jgi:hypothetical protein|nr:hypothetical protein [Clostridiaceae bacterium]
MDKIGNSAQKIMQKIIQTVRKIAVNVKQLSKELGRRISSRSQKLYRNAKTYLEGLRARIDMNKIGNSVQKIMQKILQMIRKIAVNVKQLSKELGRRISSRSRKLYRNAKICLEGLRARRREKSLLKSKKSTPAQPRSKRVSPATDLLNQTTARIVLRKLPKSKPIRRRSRERVYRLKGYTTVAKVNRKRQSERQQNVLRRLLFFVIVVLVIILLAKLYNPIQNLSEWYRILGIQDLSDLLGGQKTTTAIPISTTSTTKPTTTLGDPSTSE